MTKLQKRIFNAVLIFVARLYQKIGDYLIITPTWPRPDR